MLEFKSHHRLEALDWSDRDRFEEYREVIGRAITKLEIDPYQRDATQCQAEITLRVLPGLMMGETLHGGLVARRTRSLIDNDDVIFSATLAGQRMFNQLGRSVVLSPGDATLVTGGEVGHTIAESERGITFRLPRNQIAPLAGDIEAAIARCIPRRTEALRLLMHYANAIRDIDQFESLEAGHLASTHIADLIALAIGATRDGTEIARSRGLRAARLTALKRDIQEHLTRPDLSVSALAARHQISTSYIRKLFDGEGTSFTEFVLEQRLARAHRALRDPRSQKSVSAIAFECGFGDLSYFNRTFRRRYGLTPSELRHLRSSGQD